MKHSRMISLLAVTAMALMAFFGASSASASVLCKTDVEPCGEWDMKAGDTFTASLTNGKHSTLKAAFSTVTCKKSHVKGEITRTGGAGVEVEAKITELSFSECTCNEERVVHLKWTGEGTLSINDAGTVTSKNTTFTITCTGLAKCEFGTTTAGLDIGRFTSSNTAIPPTTAELDVEATLTWFNDPEGSSTFVCTGLNHTLTWTAEYQVTVPDALWLKKS